MNETTVGYMIAGYIATAIVYVAYIAYLFGQKRKWERGGD